VIVVKQHKSAEKSPAAFLTTNFQGDLMQDLHTLDSYLNSYGRLLARQAEGSMRPLHIPGRDPCRIAKLKRQPFEAQAHLICAGAKALARDRSLLVIGECGTGKTILGMGIAHTHAEGRTYRGLVMAPGQLCGKWERELKETLPGVQVVQLESWRDCVRLYQEHYRVQTNVSKEGRPEAAWEKPKKATWCIIARDRAKLGAKWRAAYVRRRDDDALYCPKCGHRLVKKGKTEDSAEEEANVLLKVEDLERRRLKCHYKEEGKPACGESLWQYTSELKRFEPARFIHKRLPNFFDYCILDEVHEEKSADSAQGNAVASMAAASKKVLALSGTLIGGYAEHVRPLLLRLAPTSLIQEGFGWKNSMEFSETYGRIETRITEKGGGDGQAWGEGNRQSRGKSRSTSKYTRPGIMPTLFGRHLMKTAVFLGLDEVATNLPSLEETVVGVEMDSEVADAYQHVQEKMEAVIKEMVRKGNRKFLGAFLQTLLAYPDHPYGWDDVGYREEDTFVPVVQPPNLDARPVRPKEDELLKILDKEIAEGRQVWVYTTMTGEKDVADRLQKLISKRGYRCEVLRSTVELKRREEWIAKHGPRCQCIISHPKLVETGLDLFDKAGGHNFSTLVFYASGYNLFTLRQASRRSWRIGQQLPCRVYYLYYAATMQARAMSLMGKKLSAAHAIEGKFSSDGLVALSGDDGVEMALAKSLAEQIDEGCPTRAWVKVGVTDGVSGRDMNVDDFVQDMAALTQDEEWLFPDMEGQSGYNPFPASSAEEAELALAV
jgi:SNF2 family DNA or RNA helicase